MVVIVNRTYISPNDGDLRIASLAASWEALINKLDTMAWFRGLTVKPFHGDDGTEGVYVHNASTLVSRDVHDLACRYGALAVIQ